MNFLNKDFLLFTFLLMSVAVDLNFSQISYPYTFSLGTEMFDMQEIVIELPIRQKMHNLN